MMHRPRSWTLGILAISLTVTLVLVAGSAFAAQNVGSTSQKGSVVIFSRIDIDENKTTIIRLSNDNIVGVDVTCYYMNERKGRRDFHFKLTRKQPVWWDVKLHTGSVDVAQFPDDVGGTPPAVAGNVNFGELICFATDFAGHDQIAFNHLSGTATIIEPDVDGGGQNGFTYASWNFAARDAAGTGLAADGTVMGTPGFILLTGAAGGYDACPAYLIAHYSPDGAPLRTGAGDYRVEDIGLSVVGCNQDLRQDYDNHFTKLKLNTWNGDETKFTGAYICADSYKFVETGADRSAGFVAPENLTFNVLKSAAALLRVEGVASSQCSRSVPSGLVGVLSQSVHPVDAPAGLQNEIELGVTLNGAGFLPGFIFWDPQPATVPFAPR